MKLTRAEALELADVLDTWPPGLGYALVRDPSTSRGWRRHSMRPWDLPPELGPDLKYCPVVTLHVRRGLGSHLHAEHLDAFWAIAETLATLWGVDREAARHRYNELLRTSPHVLADDLRRVGKEVPT